MDAIRGVAILLVLIQHSVTIPEYEGDSGSLLLGAVNDLFGPYRMPLLLVLSGLLLPRSLQKPMPTYVSGKIRRILWPLALWTLIVWALNPPSLDDLSSLIGPRHLWYLVVLAGCYAIGPLTRWVSPWIIAGAMAVVMITVPASVFSPAGLAGYAAFFMIGAALATALPRWQQVRWIIPAVLGMIAIGWAVAQWIIIEDPIFGASFVMSIIGVMAILWIAPRLPSPAWAEWVGQHSMVFYVAHVPVMIVAWSILHYFDVTQSELVSLILLGTAAVTCLILARVRWTQWMFAWPMVGSRHYSETPPSGVERASS